MPHGQESFVPDGGGVRRRRFGPAVVARDFGRGCERRNLHPDERLAVPVVPRFHFALERVSFRICEPQVSAVRFGAIRVAEPGRGRCRKLHQHGEVRQRDAGTDAGKRNPELLRVFGPVVSALRDRFVRSERRVAYRRVRRRDPVVRTRDRGNPDFVERAWKGVAVAGAGEVADDQVSVAGNGQDGSLVGRPGVFSGRVAVEDDGLGSIRAVVAPDDVVPPV